METDKKKSIISKLGAFIKKHKKLTIFLVIVLIIVIAIASCSKSSGVNALYTQDTAQVRNIVTYHNFSGTITPVEQKNVMTEVSGTKVAEVLVEEGDEVKAGDVIVELDKTTIEENIKEQEIAVESGKVSLQQNEATYNNFLRDRNEGLNSSIQSAQAGIDSAYATLLSARNAYNDEVTLNNKNMSSTIMSAMNGVTSAYNSLLSAQNSYEKNEYHLNNENGSYTDVYDDTLKDLTEEGAQLSLESAQDSYAQALTSYEAAKLNEESTLTKLFDNLIQAQESYISAIDSYNTAVRSADETASNYALQLESSKLSNQLNELRLANYKDQLEKYTITAPIDGTVTSLKATVGEIPTTTTVAVVTSFDKMKVDIKINEYDILGVEEGKEVEIYVSALEKTYTGSVENIAKVATIENGVSYFEAEVNFDADEYARSGMSVEVKLKINNETNAISVLSEAIQTESDGTAYVLSYDESGKNVIHKPVTVGVTDGTYTQVTEGLNEGDTVLYTPSFSFGMY
ncbi:MAG: HlyD family efflux transporter periplasmic adaptor subunit [Butyrivibrio sp.]|nr:HlyD family efflux transporter periplasmic adaptor subunit [Butyrivibrio sp.]